jgi:hypothetical protein
MQIAFCSPDTIVKYFLFRIGRLYKITFVKLFIYCCDPQITCTHSSWNNWKLEYDGFIRLMAHFGIERLTDFSAYSQQISNSTSAIKIKYVL